MKKKVVNRVAELMAVKFRQNPELAQISQGELANRIGISRSSLYNWLRNRSNRWDDQAILAFAIFFELDNIGDLLVIEEIEGDESPEHKTALVAVA